MGLLDNKSAQQVELEKKIKALQNAGMTASAERLSQQLARYTRVAVEQVKPMKPHELAKHVKAQKAMAGKAA